MAEQGPGAPASGAARSLPPDLMADLLEAYREEAAERLAVIEQSLQEPQRAQDARRATHALGSSAWVVGEREVSALARDVEARIEAQREWTEQAEQLVALMRASGHGGVA